MTEGEAESGRIWSGKRDSNPQPSAWKADALAVELFPHATVVPRQAPCLLQPRQFFVTSHHPSDLRKTEKWWWRGVDLNHRSLTTTDLQSVPFGHSGTPPLLPKSRKVRSSFSFLWSWRWDSNPQPADYKSAALPVELRQRQHSLLAIFILLCKQKIRFGSNFFKLQ